MSPYITVKKNHADFHKLLWGDFSATQVALPVTTMNVDSSEETVTFEVVDRKVISRPAWFKIFLQLTKFQNSFLVVIPLFYVLVKNYVDDEYKDPVTCLIASVAMLFLFGALNIRNEVNDHISGYDRVNLSTLPKPIKLGWISAKQASAMSWVLMVIAMLISFPVMYRQPEVARVIAIVSVLILAGQLLSKNSYKNKRFGEILFFILMGPAVVSGYQVALGAGVDTEGLIFGVVWAWAIQFLVHLNNFSHLLTSSQAGIKNTMTNAGFDKAKKILIGWWVIFIGLWAAYHFLYSSVFWSGFTTVVLIFWSIPTLIKISEIQSPVGSDLVNIKRVGYRNFLLMAGLLVLEFWWYLGVEKGWFV